MTGEIPYAEITSVESRQERLKAKGVKARYAALFVAREGAPRETLVRSGVDDHSWLNEAARDIAQRANTTVVVRDEIDAQYNGLNMPW